jgi:FlgD Ig-like domain
MLVVRHLLRSVFMIVLIAAAARAAEFEPEVPDDPPALLSSLSQQTTAAITVTQGRFTSVQVNVNPVGNNVLHDAANEPSIAVDPNDPHRIAIGWRQFDSITSNFRQAGYAWSANGGLTWTAGKIDAGLFRSDPVLGFDSQGKFFYSSLSQVLSCLLFPSSDGGRTWGPAALAWGGDKQWIAVDRTGGPGQDHVYEAWSSESNPTPGLTFSRSSDDGVTFEVPTSIPHEPIWGTLDVGPDGTVYVAGSEGPNGVLYVGRSSGARDAGAAPSFTSVPVDLGGRTVIGGPNPVGLLGQAWVAVDRSEGPRRGWVYVLASVNTPNDPLDVMFIRSTDGGLTWSAPVRVNDDVGNTALQWFGTMSVSPDGRIDVFWNDTRGQASSNLCALYYACSYDGGVTWSPNEQASPVWNSSLGYPNQQKIGDYYHAVSRVNGVDLAWAATFSGEQDVYFLRLAWSAIGAHDRPLARLTGAAPNPFRSSTRIGFEAGDGARATLRVFDASGRHVATLLDGEVKGGGQSVVWSGRDDQGRPLPPGLYLARLVTGGRVQTAKLMLLR